MIADSKHSPESEAEENAVWERYEADRSERNRNLVFEFYWDWMQSCVAKWVKKDLDIALSHVAERLLSFSIPDRHKHLNIKTQSYLRCDASTAVMQWMREEMPTTYHFRKKNKAVRTARERLSKELMRQPTDAETAAHLGWSEIQVISSSLPRMLNFEKVQQACELNEEYGDGDCEINMNSSRAITKDFGHDVCADDEFHNFWKNLPSRQRRILISRYYYGKNQQQIAAQFGRSQAWVNEISQRAERNLDRFLKNSNN